MKAERGDFLASLCSLVSGRRGLVFATFARQPWDIRVGGSASLGCDRISEAIVVVLPVVGVWCGCVALPRRCVNSCACRQSNLLLHQPAVNQDRQRAEAAAVAAAEAVLRRHQVGLPAMPLTSDELRSHVVDATLSFFCLFVVAYISKGGGGGAKCVHSRRCN